MVLQRQGYAQIGLSAAGVAFWFIIAAFPALIATIVILGLFLDPTRVDEVVKQLDAISPGSFGATILQQVQTAAASEPSTLSWSLTISLLFFAWSASSGVYNLSRGMRWAYGLPRRNYLWARTRALAGSLTIILALAAVTVTISAASAAASSQTGWRAWASYTALVVGAVVLLLGIMSALYAFAIGRSRPRPRILPGALISAIGVMGVYIGLGIALRFTAGYQAVYGALAGTIIVMMVLYISSYIMLIGALVNGRWDIAASKGHSPPASASVVPAKSGT